MIEATGSGEGHDTKHPSTMDITKFVVSSREKALLYGDYSTYWSQLSGKLLNSRKKLNIATKSSAKFNPKAPVTPEQIAENHEYAVAASVADYSTVR